MRSQKLKLLFPVAVMLACGLALPAQAAPSQERHATSDGIKGLIVNQTISANGYEFYLIFTELWRDKPDGENYSLNIVERPSKRYGNQVFVYFGQRRVYSGFLPFKYDGIRPVCEKAVEESYSNIITLGMETLGSGDPDFSSKDEF